VKLVNLQDLGMLHMIAVFSDGIRIPMVQLPVAVYEASLVIRKRPAAAPGIRKKPAAAKSEPPEKVEEDGR
jgi:hypothetical protein